MIGLGSAGAGVLPIPYDAVNPAGAFETLRAHLGSCPVFVYEEFQTRSEMMDPSDVEFVLLDHQLALVRHDPVFASQIAYLWLAWQREGGHDIMQTHAWVIGVVIRHALDAVRARSLEACQVVSMCGMNAHSILVWREVERSGLTTEYHRGYIGLDQLGV